MPNKNRGDFGARVQIKAGGDLDLMATAVLAELSGFSIPHTARIQRNVNQLGEPFIAAVLAAMPRHKFEDLFVVVRNARVESTVTSASKYVNKVPHSWHEAFDYGYEPERGPETFVGSGEFAPDRIVLRDQDGPGIAFEEDGTIRLFGRSKKTEWVIGILEAVGFDEEHIMKLPARIPPNYPGRVK